MGKSELLSACLEGSWLHGTGQVVGLGKDKDRACSAQIYLAMTLYYRCLQLVTQGSIDLRDVLNCVAIGWPRRGTRKSL